MTLPSFPVIALADLQIHPDRTAVAKGLLPKTEPARSASLSLEETTRQRQQSGDMAGFIRARPLLVAVG